MIIEIELHEPITVKQLKEKLGRAQLRMDASLDMTHSLLIDASGCETYEREAREWFAKVWAPPNKQRVDKIAIVTNSVILRMAATAVGLVAGYRIDAFKNADAAARWLAKK